MEDEQNTKGEHEDVESGSSCALADSEIKIEIAASEAPQVIRLEESLQEQLEAARSTIREKQESYLRIMAEMDNLRRRTTREIEQSRQFAIEIFARDLLGVADNLERAMAVLTQNAEDELQGPVKAVIDGVHMVQSEMRRVFEKHGLVRIDPVATPFDPHFHQAMFEMESHDAKPGTVVQVLQSGYLLKGRLIRPAMVGVAKESSDDASQASL